MSESLRFGEHANGPIIDWICSVWNNSTRMWSHDMAWDL